MTSVSSTKTTFGSWSSFHCEESLFPGFAISWTSPSRRKSLGETLTLRGFELSSDRKRSSIVHRPDRSVDGAAIRARTHQIDRQWTIVLDFEVTANRPDALSIIGFAREVGTAYSLPVKPLVPKPLPVETHGRCLRHARGAGPVSAVRCGRCGCHDRALARLARSPGCRPQACGPSTTWWTSPTTC